MSNSALLQKIAHSLECHNLIQPDDTIWVCVSGGSDSVALLLLLLEWQPRWNYHLQVLHFDHGVREESAQDRVFVEALAQQYGLPCHTETTAVLGQATSGFQEKARAWRRSVIMRLLSESAAPLGTQRVATAHHQDDQMETLLLKILRGCHLSHLQGMAWKQDPYIRPLLNCSKEELQTYLHHKQQPWVEDASNQLPKYLRNRIRHELIPLMDELARGALYTRLNELTEQSGQLRQWTQQAESSFWDNMQPNQEVLEISLLQALSPWVGGAILNDWLNFHQVPNLNYAHIQTILRQLQGGTPQWKLHLPNKFIIERQGDQLFLQVPHLEWKQTQLYGDLHITNTLGPHWQIRCHRIQSQEPPPEDGMILYNVPLQATLTLRFRQDGDRFHPHWKPHSIKLKDFLRDQGFPLHERNQVPLICVEARLLAIYPQFRAASVYADQGLVPPLSLSIEAKKPR